MLRHQDLYVLGSDETARRLLAGLRASGSSARLLDAPPGARALRRARAVVVTPGGRQGLAGLAARGARRAPLPVVLFSEAQWPEAAPPVGEGIVLRPFSVFEQAARWLLLRYPIHACVDVLGGQMAHGLLWRMSPLNEAIAVQFMHLCHYGGPRPRLTWLDPRPEDTRRDFYRRYPQAHQVCELDFRAPGDWRPEATAPVTAIYAGHSSLEGAAPILARTSPAPIYLQVTGLRSGASVETWNGRTFPYDAWSAVCTPEHLLGEAGDALARTIHEYYRDSVAAQGRDLTATPAGRPWETLGESFRQASRHQADHIEAKLAAIDCRSVPEERSELFTFTPAEAERLARIEHDRWSADRYLAGWRFGEQRDDARRLHPTLVPYAELSAPMQDLDRYAVRLVPALLGRTGRGVARNLRLGAAVNGTPARDARPPSRLFARTLARLERRFSDRTLVLYTALEGTPERALARQALERGLGLRVVLWQPIETLLETLSDAERGPLLDLLAHAEQRLRLADRDAWQALLAARSEVLMALETGPGSAEILERHRQAVRRRPGASARQVRLHLTEQRAEWGFEY